MIKEMANTLERYFACLLTCCLIIFGCSTPKDEQGNIENKKLKVVSTTGMLHDAVINIAGTSVDATVLMQPGVDPHLYKASQGDLNKLTEADLIFYNGLHLEGKMGEVLVKVAKLKPTIAIAESIPKDRLRKLDDGSDLYDPHVWFDASLWKEVVKHIKDQLIMTNPNQKELYESNTLSYLAKLDSLHVWTKKSIDSIPQDHRIMITAHDAFGYFGDAYQIEVRGLQGISTLSEFGLKDVAELVNLIINRKVKSIFVETSVSPKAIEAVAAGCKEKGHVVQIGGKLYSDAMGTSGTVEGTYIGMFKSNVETIVNGLK